MPLQYLAVHLQLLMTLFWIDITGQIMVEDTYRRAPDSSPVVFEVHNGPSSGSSCTTPDEKAGNCERWMKCETLSQKVKTWDELRLYMCGFAGSEPKVCCPSTPQPNIFGPATDLVYPIDINSETANTASSSRPRINPSQSGATNTASSSRPRTNPSQSGAANTASSSRPRTNPSQSGATNTASSPRPRTNPSRSPDAKPIFLPDDCGSSMFFNNRVIGGQKAERGTWPWMAVILSIRRNGPKVSKEAFCGGALVTARHVVTAAHCVVKPNTNIPFNLLRHMVRVGVHDLSIATDPDTMDVGLDTIHIHERYDLRIRTNDIAVIRLSEPVPFSNYIAPVCLPYDSLRYEDLSGKSSTVTGFGLTSVNISDSYSDVLIEVSFDIQDQEECRKIYEREYLRITDGHLCAGTLDGSRDACQGDSGGPLVTVGKEKRFYLIGIVSFGKNCSTPGYPGVYTRVTKYLDWLTPKLAD